jgi:hypothetical protein
MIKTAARMFRERGIDGMTADFYPFDMKFLGKTATRIINEVKGVNRVVYDVTSKPPGPSSGSESEGARLQRRMRRLASIISFASPASCSPRCTVPTMRRNSTGGGPACSELALIPPRRFFFKKA